jgi:hypothetical protein
MVASPLQETVAPYGGGRGRYQLSSERYRWIELEHAIETCKRYGFSQSGIFDGLIRSVQNSLAQSQHHPYWEEEPPDSDLQYHLEPSIESPQQ